MDLGINIYGVKIYSHSIMKKHPYIASYSCEVAQTKRLREDGYVGMLNHSFAYLFPHRQNKQFRFLQIISLAEIVMNAGMWAFLNS